MPGQTVKEVEIVVNLFSILSACENELLNVFKVSINDNILWRNKVEFLSLMNPWLRTTISEATRPATHS